MASQQAASPGQPPPSSNAPNLTTTPDPAPTTTPRPKTGGRPRVNIDDHKDQILSLYASKTPWQRIESTLLEDHGLKAQGRTIMRRMKEEWGVEFRRVETKHAQKQQIKARIAALWADQATRPKDDAELHVRLCGEGFTVSLGAMIALRKEMHLFRRWDEKLGRVRPPTEELSRHRKPRPQRQSAYTGAQLAPPPAGSGDEGEEASQERQEDRSSPQQPPAEPTPDANGIYPGLTLPKPKSRKRGRPKSSSAQPTQPAKKAPKTAQPTQSAEYPQPAQPQPRHSTPPQAAPLPQNATQQAPPRPAAVLSETDKDM